MADAARNTVILYYHPEFQDVCIQIKKVRYRGPKYIKARIVWWNKGQTGAPWCCYLEEKNRKLPIAFFNELRPKAVIPKTDLPVI